MSVVSDQKDNSSIINENSFDVIRLIAAFIVCFSHSFRHMGIEKPWWTLFFTDCSIGVNCFFVMTGFLMMYSWDNTVKKSGRYNYLSFFKRALRIYPAIWFSFLFICFIDFGLVGENFRFIPFVKYFIRYNFLGLGDAYGVNGLANGVMWTIPVDIMFYLITPLIYCLMKKLSMIQSILIIFIFWLFNVFDNSVMSFFGAIPVFGQSLGLFICLIYEFMIGCFVYFNLELLLKYINKTSTFIFLCVFTLIYGLYWNLDMIPKTYVMHSPIISPLCCILIMCIAFSFGKVRIKVDISYGVFIYHMIIVGTLHIFGVNGVIGIFITPLLSCFLSIISFWLIEKKSVEFGKKIERRLSAYGNISY